MRQKATLLSRLRRFVAHRASGPEHLDARTAYDLWSRSYDNATGNVLLFAEERAVRPLLESVPLKGAAILDAGCGTGRYFPSLLAREPRILVGFDFSRGMLRTTAAKFRQKDPIHLLEAGFPSLPFKAASFDLVLCTLAIDHTPGLPYAIQEMARVLQPDGTIVLSCFHPFASLLGWKRTFLSERRLYAVQYVPYKTSDYLNAFRSAGLEIVRVEEPVIDTTVLHLYKHIGREDFYQRSQGHPLCLVFHLRKDRNG